MKDAFWRGLSYVGFLGLFIHLYGRSDVARHGRRGFVVFIWEVIGLVVVDVIRLKLGWPPVIFVPVVAAVAIFKIVLIIRAVRERRAATERVIP